MNALRLSRWDSARNALSRYMIVLETEQGTLALIWLVRFLCFLALVSSFVRNRGAYSDSEADIIRDALVLFFLYMIGVGALGLYKHDWFVRRSVKLTQVGVEIVAYSIFYYLTQDPNSNVYFLYFLPLYVAGRYLGRPLTIALLGFASLGLYWAITMQTGSLMPTQNALEVYLPRVLFMIVITMFLALRRRPPSQAALQAEASRLVAAFQKFQDGLFVVDSNQRLLFVNDALQAKHGPSWEGQTCKDYFNCPDIDCSACHPLRDSDSLGQPAPARAARFRDCNGISYEVEITYAPLPGEDDLCLGTIALVKDISDRRNAERQWADYVRLVEYRAQSLQDERVAWLETFKELSQRLSSATDVGELLQFVVDTTRQRLKAETAAIFLVEDDYLVRKAISGVESDWFPEERYAMGEGITGQVLAAVDNKYGQSVLENNVSGHAATLPKHLSRYISRLPSREVRHLLAVPLNGQAGAVGVLRVVNKLDSRHRLAKEGFQRFDRDTLQAIASFVAMAVENARLFEETQRQVEDLNHIYQQVPTLAAPPISDETLRAIVERAGEVAKSDCTGVILVADDGTLVNAVEDNRIVNEPDIRARPNGVTWEVIRTGRPKVYDDVAQDDPKHNPFVLERGFKSYAGIPIKVRDQVRGVLFVHSHQPGAFRSRIRLLSTVANQALAVHENTRLLAELEHQRQMFERLVEVTKELMMHTTRDELYASCADHGASLFDVEDCSILILDEGREWVDLVASSGVPPAVWRQRQVRLDDPGLTAYVARTGETLNFGDDEYKEHPAWGGRHGSPFVGHLQYLPSQRCHSLGITPLKDSQGRNVGVLKIENRCGEGVGRGLSPFEESLLKTYALFVGMAVERARLFEQLDAAARREARESLSDDLHEIYNVVHGALILRLAHLHDLALQAEADALVPELDLISKGAHNVYDELRRMFRDVRDPVLEREGLMPALRHYVQWLSITADFRDESKSIRLPVDIEYELYKIGQSALSNAAKHAAHAGHVEVGLSSCDACYEFWVCDDGPGFDAAEVIARDDAFGLQSMRRRAESIDSRLKVETHPGAGVRIQVVGCLEEEHDDRRNSRADR